jgi:hypothetical protein
MGEFSPIGQLLSLGRLSKPTEVAKMFWAIHLCTHFNKNGLGYILGDFCANPSGHPARERHNGLFPCVRGTHTHQPG